MILLVELYLEELKQVWPTFPEQLLKKRWAVQPQERVGGWGGQAAGF